MAYDDDDDLKLAEVITLNNRCYCAEHLRDVCHECSLDFMPFCPPFELPENGRPEYPVPFQDDDRESALLAKRWLEMQRAMYSAPVSPLTSSHVQLPKWGGTSSVREALLGLFHQVLPMCATQRYFFANQPLIMLQECETFEQAIFLHEANLQETLDRKFSLLARTLGCFYDLAAEMKKKSRASYVGAFGFLLELHTQRTFWRTMELTAEAYIRLLEQPSDDNHEDVLKGAKTELLQWIGHVFWSFRHAQHVLDELRKQQHMMYQRNEFPFYPACDLDALEDGLDVHLIIAKLSRGPAHDLPFMASTFDAFRQASDDYPEQMADVSSAIMVAIDEMSARFRVLEILTRAGQAVASCELEVKTALLRFKFDSTGIELFSAMDDASTVITEMDASEYRTPTPKDRSSLQELLALERSCRLRHRHKFLTLPVQDTCAFTKEMFDAFKPTYNKLYSEAIRALWKNREKPLLQLSVNRRPIAVQTQKKKKKKPAAGPPAWEVGDIAEARSVPDELIVDPELFWNTGAPPAERYKPPVVREKIKTRKATVAPDLCTTPPSPVEESLGPSPSPRRSLDQLKESDLKTRDVLWRKVKGLVKWSSIVQLLARLGCRIENLDGSKKKVKDEHTKLCAVLHRPHPGEDCRRDQLDRYRMQLEDWLHINYEDIVTPEEATSSRRCTRTSSDSTQT